MEIFKPILVAALLALVPGLICEIFVPGSGRIIDVAAAAFALAAWVVPLLLAARSWTKKPNSSLAGVGATIGFFVVAASLSAMGISLALMTLIFAREANWAWPTLIAIAAFWLSGVIVLKVGGRVGRKARGVAK